MSDNDHMDDENQGLVADFFTFLKEEKMWWIIPLVVIFLLLGMIMILGDKLGFMAPFIYPFA